MLACLRGRSGQSLVEFAIVIPVVLALFFSIFELSRLMYTRLTVRHAIMESARTAVTGNQIEDPENPGELLSRAETIREIIQQKSIGLAVELDSIRIDPADGGDPEEVVSVSVGYTYSYMFPGFDGVFPDLYFRITTSMRNEPFYR